jgi:hypothetical protein
MEFVHALLGGDSRLRIIQPVFKHCITELLTQVRMAIEFQKSLKRDEGRLFRITAYAGSKLRPEPVRHAFRQKDFERHPASLDVRPDPFLPFRCEFITNNRAVEHEDLWPVS